jgi:SAM-dependent methyltransferase
MTCVDISPAAIAAVLKRHPEVEGCVADAASLPFQNASFDLVTSQFGLEYAGLSAFGEALRVTAVGGTLACVAHLSGGGIDRVYRRNVMAIRKFRESGFVRRAADLFRHGFAAVRGADREPYENAGRRMAPAVAAVESLLGEFGVTIADGTIGRIYEDVARIHERLPAHDPDEVMAWIDCLEPELAAYADRIRSVLDAALTQADIDALGTQILEAGFDEPVIETLRNDAESTAVGWTVRAQRRLQQDNP